MQIRCKFVCSLNKGVYSLAACVSRIFLRDTIDTRQIERECETRTALFQSRKISFNREMHEIESISEVESIIYIFL